MMYRVEAYNETLQDWVPWTECGFTRKEDAETRRLEILAEYGAALVDKGRLRVAEFETDEERRARLLAGWRELFPEPETSRDRLRESILFGLASTDGIEEALIRASRAIESGESD